MLPPMIKVAICCAAGQELLVPRDPSVVSLHYHHELDQFLRAGADIYIDAAFQWQPERLERLRRLSPAPLLINEVIHTLETLPSSFIRYNGWKGFACQPVLECCSREGRLPETLLRVAEACGWSCQLVPDQPGMVRPRILAMVINEAYYALGEQVATSTDIDTAMKTGTNYPFGPFEWGMRIGLDKIYTLLEVLARQHPKYKPAPALSEAVTTV